MPKCGEVSGGPETCPDKVYMMLQHGRQCIATCVQNFGPTRLGDFQDVMLALVPSHSKLFATAASGEGGRENSTVSITTVVTG